MEDLATYTDVRQKVKELIVEQVKKEVEILLSIPFFFFFCEIEIDLSLQALIPRLDDSLLCHLFSTLEL